MRFQMLRSMPMHGSLMILPVKFYMVEQRPLPHAKDVLALIECGGMVVENPTDNACFDQLNSISCFDELDCFVRRTMLNRVVLHMPEAERRGAVLLDTRTGELYAFSNNPVDVVNGGNLLSFLTDAPLKASDSIEFQVRSRAGSAVSVASALRDVLGLLMPDAANIAKGHAKVCLTVAQGSQFLLRILAEIGRRHRDINAGRNDPCCLMTMNQILQIQEANVVHTA